MDVNDKMCECGHTWGEHDHVMGTCLDDNCWCIAFASVEYEPEEQ